VEANVHSNNNYTPPGKGRKAVPISVRRATQNRPVKLAAGQQLIHTILSLVRREQPPKTMKQNNGGEWQIASNDRPPRWTCDDCRRAT
jgi:hypothetical protein